MNTGKCYLYLVILLILLPICIHAGAHRNDNKEVSNGETVPLFVSELSAPADYQYFATSGWTGNWYVGYDHGWVQELPPVPKRDDYKLAFLGAKLGRSKPDKDATIKIGVSQDKKWGRKNSFNLMRVRDIPLEGDSAVPLAGVGEARWFWVEIPIGLVSKEQPNYVALWTKDPFLVSASTCPILAAGSRENIQESSPYHIGPVSGVKNTWLVENYYGDPSTGTWRPISFYEPALAIKLIPENKHIINISLIELNSGSILCSIEGTDVVCAWLEISKTGSGKWERYGRYLWDPPYIFDTSKISIERGRYRVRVGARDNWHNIGYSKELTFRK